MDLRDDVLATLDFRAALYFQTDFAEPWAAKVPDLEGAARFHLIVEGQCHVGFGEGAFHLLGPGDLILIPRGKSHILADKPVRDAPELGTIMDQCAYHGDGPFKIGKAEDRPRTKMICGHLTFRPLADHPILRALPDHLIISNATRAREPFLDDVLRLISRQVLGGAPGSSASATRLSEVMFIELVRCAIKTSPALSRFGILFSSTDDHIGKAATLIHAEPEKDWTLTSLARAVGMSRSRFAERFTDLVGQPPMTYLTDWRLQTALKLLSQSKLPIQTIASQTGYHSPAAFTRAFRSKFGQSPSDYRRISA